MALQEFELARRLHALGHDRTLAKNDVAFVDPTGVDHDALGAGLKKAIYNYMHGIGLEEDVRMWFPFKVPKTTVRRDRIERALRERG